MDLPLFILDEAGDYGAFAIETPGTMVGDQGEGTVAQHWLQHSHCQHGLGGHRGHGRLGVFIGKSIDLLVDIGQGIDLLVDIRQGLGGAIVTDVYTTEFI